jgi:hypothetical protein
MALSVINSLLGHTSEAQMFDVLQPSVALIATFTSAGDCSTISEMGQNRS